MFPFLDTVETATTIYVERCRSLRRLFASIVEEPRRLVARVIGTLTPADNTRQKTTRHSCASFHRDFAVDARASRYS